MTPTPEPPPFDFSGDALPLDFANTWADRANPATDSLVDFAALVRFALQAGLVDGARAGSLLQAAEREPAGAVTVWRRGRELRDALYAVLAARARGREVPDAAVARIEAALRRALPHLHLVAVGDGFGWAWEEEGAPDLEAPLWPIARAGAELLVSPDLARVHECDGERCTWLFLDHSRGRSRRWCSMSSCGNRAKARRHYHRRQAPDGA